jgi:hypothetical protein
VPPPLTISQQRVSHTEEERRRLEIEMERKASEHERAMREKEALQVRIPLLVRWRSGVVGFLYDCWCFLLGGVTHVMLALCCELQEMLQGMQEKLLVGGQVLDRAAKQEEELRRAQLELEERRRQEASLARELEEANVRASL